VTDGITGACAYELDAELRIRAVDTAWSEFAQANEAPELVVPPGPVGQSIFDHIQDATTVHLYRRLFERVLRTGQSVVFPFRCDSPAMRRFLMMEIRPGPGSGLHLLTGVVRLESRPPSALLERFRHKGSELLRMCSWCKMVEIPNRWCEVEEAVVVLRLFEHQLLPAITHGICPPCYRRAEALLE
jgi:hypothetical protein